MAKKEKRTNYVSYTRKCLLCHKEFCTTKFERHYCCAECKKKAEKEKERNKKKVKSIREICIAAEKQGMTYGKYVSKYGV